MGGGLLALVSIVLLKHLLRGECYHMEYEHQAPHHDKPILITKEREEAEVFVMDHEGKMSRCHHL